MVPKDVATPGELVSLKCIVTRMWSWLKHHTSTYECIRVPYGYIRVHTNDIRINTSNIRVHTSNIRIHNDKNGNIQVTYEYIGYQEGNKHKMYHFRFTFHFYMCSRPVLRTYVSARNCLKRAPTTHTRVCHIQTYAIRMLHPHKQTWSLMWHDTTLLVQ